jgi:hypothetical protein
MTTPLVICQLKMYVDAADYYAPGAITSMIQMKSRLETLEEATKRTIFEQEWTKKCNPKNEHYKMYIDKADYDTPGVITSMIQMKSRLETLEETQIRENPK